MGGELSDLIDKLIMAARTDGWESDQGTGNAPEQAAAALSAARKALVDHLYRYDTGFALRDEDLGDGGGTLPSYV